MTNALLLQNILGRLTHGLIGLDLYQQESARNQYLNDFLTLETSEVEQALVAGTPRGLVPSQCEVSLEEFGTILTDITKAQHTVKNLEKEKPETIQTTIRNLKKTVTLLYGACAQ